MRKLRRDKIVEVLRASGNDELADRAERELPERIDTDRMGAKLQSLGISFGGLPLQGGGGGAIGGDGGGGMGGGGGGG